MELTTGMDSIVPDPRRRDELATSPAPNKEYHALSRDDGDRVANNNPNDRIWAMKLFSITTILLFADQNLMSPNLTAIAEEFGFDDEERDVKLGGQIALAFWLLGAPAAIVVGVLADQFNRSRLFAWTVGIGEGACFLTFWTKTYRGLYVCRALTGFSFGGALPLIYSILGDLFPAEERHKVNAFVGLGTGLGISIGQGVAGFLGPTFGWRLPFLLVSTPALVCAALVLWTVEDPERGGMERAVLERKKEAGFPVTNVDEMGYSTTTGSIATLQQREKVVEMQRLRPLHDTKSVRRRSRTESTGSLKPDGDGLLPPIGMDPSEFINDKPAIALVRCHLQPAMTALRLLCKTPTVIFAMMQGVPGCLPWGIVNTYLNDFLAEDRGMSVELATLTVLFFGAGNFFGLVLGGAGGHYLYMIDKRYPALLAGSMSIFGCVPFWVLLNGVNNNSSFIFAAFVALLAGTATGVTGPIIKATLTNVTLPQMRGQAFALFNTADDFGRGLGPVFISYLITSIGGRTPAFNLGTLGWAVCGTINLMIFFTAERDEQRTQAYLSATWDQPQTPNSPFESDSR